MPRYFFHYFDGHELIADDRGLQLASAEQAYLEAVAGARAMWPELLSARTDPMVCEFHIADAEGTLLFKVAFSELIDACKARSTKPPCSPVVAELTHGMVRVREAVDAFQHECREVRRNLRESTQLMEQLSRFTRAGCAAGS